MSIIYLDTCFLPILHFGGIYWGISLCSILSTFSFSLTYIEAISGKQEKKEKKRKELLYEKIKNLASCFHMVDLFVGLFYLLV